MSNRQSPEGRKRQRGVGLIEVLIAILVFAVGVLGMISMQLAAKRANYEATQRSVATSLARDLLERMRSNPAQLDAYVVDKMGLQTAPGTLCTKAAPCSEAQLAAYDLYDWSRLLNGENERLGGVAAGGLVQPLACVTNTNGNVSVSIIWQGVAELADPNEPCAKNSTEYPVVDGKSQRRVLTMTSYIAEL